MIYEIFDEETATFVFTSPAVSKLLHNYLSTLVTLVPIQIHVKKSIFFVLDRPDKEFIETPS